MLISVQRITASLELAKSDPAAPPPPKVLRESEGPEMVLPASIARLERAADDHGRKLATGFRGARVRVSSARSGSGGGPLLSPTGGASGLSPRLVQRAIRMSRGESLPAPVLGKLESHFGQPLGDVRVHTDPAAAEAARGLHAKAFALGSHIYFGRGQFNPSTPAGLGLIGHEVAHVDQCYPIK